MFDHSVGKGMFKFVQSSFVAGELLANVGFFLVGGVGDYDIILRPANAE